MAMDWLATHTLAVVPARLGRLQWMLALLPHAIIVLAGLCLVVVLWRKLGRRVALIGLGALLWPARSRATAVERPGTGSSSFGPWLTFMADCRRTGGAPGAGGPKSGEQLWAFRDGLSRGPFGGSPAVVGDRVYVGSDNRKLYCLGSSRSDSVTALDTETGAEQSRFHTDGALAGFAPGPQGLPLVGLGYGPNAPYGGQALRRLAVRESWARLRSRGQGRAGGGRCRRSTLAPFGSCARTTARRCGRQEGSGLSPSPIASSDGARGPPHPPPAAPAWPARG